ncbi:hypothetical protein Leryth_020063 [Lithospermum erythrorhizon]|nr:hypothetical protein Leryth_020063 [Lithospermum erythrorhizon]
MPGGVTLQCKSPVTDGSSMTPTIAPTLSPQASVDPFSPTYTTSTGLTPAGTEAPTTIENAERRPSDNNPAASSAALDKVSLLLLAMLGAVVLGCY